MTPINSAEGRVGSVGLATCYRLDGPGIESRWGGEIFRTRPDRPWGPPSLLYNGYRVFPGSKSARRDVDHPPHLAPSYRKNKAIPLLLLRAFVACSRVTFTFTFTLPVNTTPKIRETDSKIKSLLRFYRILNIYMK